MFNKAKELVINEIRDSKTIPEAFKDDLIPIVSNHFAAMEQTVGVLCLTHIRAIQHCSEYNSDGTVKNVEGFKDRTAQ